MSKRRAAQRGFTMVEAIVAIVILGIVGAIVAVFIRGPIAGYADSVGRMEAVDEADLALRRMGRDIRLALPNSVRVSGNGSSLELLLTRTGGRYLSADDGASSGEPLDFENAANTGFTVVGGLASPVLQGDFLVVYNLGMAPADAYQLNAPSPAGRNIARIGAAAARGATRITLATNPFAQQDEPMPSPGHRFQVVSDAVIYRCQVEGGRRVIRRHSGYAIEPQTPALPQGGSSAVLATRVADCDGIFRYDPQDDADSGELQRSGLVILTLGLETRGTSGADAGAVRLVHQVHIDNTP